jgi:hypothetical protein
MAGIGDSLNGWKRFSSSSTTFRLMPSGSMYSCGSNGFSNFAIAVEERARFVIEDLGIERDFVE